MLARPVALPAFNTNGKCPHRVRISVHMDLTESGGLVIQHREQHVDRNEAHKNFNDMGSYEMCHGKELTPPASPKDCSVGNRINDDPVNPCLTRLEQMTHEEAAHACRERGGQLVGIRNMQEALALQKFGNNRRDLGIGMRDYGADDDWRFEDGMNATNVIGSFEQAFEANDNSNNGKNRRRRRSDAFRRGGCLRLSARRRKGPVLMSSDCASKSGWVCEGTVPNPPVNAVAHGDLMADEGAFCLWHAHEPVDLLPNDEGTNFRNTDLQCHLQVSSNKRKQCKFNPNGRRRGLVKKRGSRHNGENFPVNGSVVGLTGGKASMEILKLMNADDQFHCHYTPSNTGLLRMYTMQHMFDRNYHGSMQKLCGCGYRHLAQLVSRCDCTRTGRADNNCARWHRLKLIEATQSSNPVRCNNCNAKDNL